jgi:hypothetical protein
VPKNKLLVKIDKNIMASGHRKEGEKVLLYIQGNTKKIMI